MKRICYQSESQTPWGPIKLEQIGRDNFTVTYGKQIDSRLSYANAAAKLGQALMHWAACEGKLDNRAKGER